MKKIKKKLLLYAKNFAGWNTNRKIVVLAFDDFGNIRIASQNAKENLGKAGLNINGNRFDQYDALETAQDLEMLYSVLRSVKDANNKPAVITAYAMPANIDFDKVRQSGYTEYHYETLPQTLNRLDGYQGSWNLWKEGIGERLLIPQFHGREHLNLIYFNSLLRQGDAELKACIDNNSFGAFSKNKGLKLSYTAAFDYNDKNDLELHKAVIKDGLKVFKDVFGYSATCFNAPGVKEHTALHKTLAEGGIKYVDADIIRKEKKLDTDGKAKEFNFLGKKNKFGQTYLIRNAVFEPLLDNYNDTVANCLMAIKVAFDLKKPAIISSHRVNFSGHIEPEVREKGLREFKLLLSEIVKRWPDAEFLTANELGELIDK